MEREDALDALAEGYLPDRERGAGAAAMHADHHALENLNALLVALAHLHVTLHRVARLHRRTVGQLRSFDNFNRAHLRTAPSLKFSRGQLPQYLAFLVIQIRRRQQIRPALQRPRNRFALAPAPYLGV